MRVDVYSFMLIEKDRMTVASLLKKHGYRTGCVGKWHLGYTNNQPCDFTGKLTPGPLDLGFDYHFAVPQNHGDYWGVYVENDQIYGLRSKKESKKGTDLFLLKYHKMNIFNDSVLSKNV